MELLIGRSSSIVVWHLFMEELSLQFLSICTVAAIVFCLFAPPPFFSPSCVHELIDRAVAFPAFLGAVWVEVSWLILVVEECPYSPSKVASL